MDDLNWNKFKQAYKNASLERKEIFNSENSPLCIKKIVNINKLDNSHYTKMLNIYGLYILGAKTDKEAVSDLRSLAIPKSNNVHKQIITCLNIKNVNKELEADIKETELMVNKINKKHDLLSINKQSSSQDIKNEPRWETEA